MGCCCGLKKINLKKEYISESVKHNSWALPSETDCKFRLPSEHDERTSSASRAGSGSSSCSLIRDSQRENTTFGKLTNWEEEWKAQEAIWKDATNSSTVKIIKKVEDMIQTLEDDQIRREKWFKNIFFDLKEISKSPTGFSTSSQQSFTKIK